MTECNQKQFGFQALGKREVVADFKGGDISSDGGGLLLQEVERQRGWITPSPYPVNPVHPVKNLPSVRNAG